MYNIYVMCQLAMLYLHSESVVLPFSDCCRLSIHCSIPATLQAMRILPLSIKKRAAAGKDFGAAVTIEHLLRQRFPCRFEPFTARCQDCAA